MLSLCTAVPFSPSSHELTTPFLAHFSYYQEIHLIFFQAQMLIPTVDASEDMIGESGVLPGQNWELET